MAASAGVRSSGELSGKQVYLRFLGVEFSRMEISRVGVGGISSPELGQAQRLVGRFSSSELGGFSEPRNELGHFTQQSKINKSK